MHQHLFIILFCTGIVPFVSSVSYFRYYVVKDKKTWSDAQAYCQATYTDLAIIKTNDNLIQIQDEANRQQFISKAWIGVYNDVNSWRWSLGNKPLGNMTIWAPGQPSNNRGMQSCGAIAPQGWDDRYCTDMTPFVCFDETKNGSDRYIYNSKNTTWIEAQSYCRQYYTDLASTSDETEYTLIHDMATPLQIHTWIGLFRDSWKWIDETPLSLVPWKIGKPDNFQRNESCAILYQNQLEDSLCSVLRPFFCYDVIKKQQTVKVKIQSNQDMNEFKTEILEQIKLKLVEDGMAGNITVKWRVQTDGAVFHKEDAENNNAGDKDKCIP
ncbi:C-type mannose receptor 2-like [Silurus meridionalis]|uniref:C-type mannose receptor 2-like n=1 Tax=Silurus meridionalis TaxID=175797 RepID=UPI001EEAC1E5|nr:C-type mannose receptor 2-like [Silurus meridionalis]